MFKRKPSPDRLRGILVKLDELDEMMRDTNGVVMEGLSHAGESIGDAKESVDTLLALQESVLLEARRAEARLRARGDLFPYAQTA